MMLNRTNLVLATLLGFTVLGAAATRVDYTRPNIEVLPDMKYTPAWVAFETNPLFSNGQTMQTPVPGTIARGELPLHYADTKQDAMRAGDELSNPVQLAAASDPALLVASSQRGAETYRVFCIVCHGATGNGDGPVAKKGFPPPPSLLTGNSRQMKDGQIFHLLTYGQANMPAFAGQLSRAQRWDLVNYIRSLQPPAASPDLPDVAPGAETSQPANEVSSESE